MNQSDLPKLYLVIPTANRHKYLSRIIENSNLNRENIILVRTTEGDEIKGAINHFHIRNTLNIQTWWNVGIGIAQDSGARYVAILSDDVKFERGQLQELLRETISNSAALGCGPNSNGGKWGHAFILDLHSGIRPDERFSWWYGDDDLRLQAKRLGGFLQTGAEFIHIEHNRLTIESKELQELARVDRQLFYKKYPQERIKLGARTAFPRLFEYLLKLRNRVQ